METDGLTGKRLAAARKNVQLSQRSLAEALGISVRTIQNYEAGRFVPYRHLNALAMLLERSPTCGAAAIARARCTKRNRPIDGGRRHAGRPMTPLEMQTGGSFGSSKRQAERVDAAAKPRLVFFYSPSSGRCRRVEAHLAHALQHRRNHSTFELVRVNVEERPDLAEHFKVAVVPTLVVVEGRRVARRIVSPRSTLELERALEAWLR